MSRQDFATFCLYKLSSSLIKRIDYTNACSINSGGVDPAGCLSLSSSSHLDSKNFLHGGGCSSNSSTVSFIPHLGLRTNRLTAHSKYILTPHPHLQRQPLRLYFHAAFCAVGWWSWKCLLKQFGVTKGTSSDLLLLTAHLASLASTSLCISTIYILWDTKGCTPLIHSPHLC